MKYLFILFCFLITFSACRKKENCTKAEIISPPPYGCGGYGVKIGTISYPSSNIPSAYQVPGMKVCINYEIYDDMRLCPSPCCGGKWVNIKTIQPDN